MPSPVSSIRRLSHQRAPGSCLSPINSRSYSPSSTTNPPETCTSALFWPPQAWRVQFPSTLCWGWRAYPHCLAHPSLSACLGTNLYNVPLMSPQQLREAIENRLALAGARAEAGLIDSLLADVGAEPGNLALLEHALSQLWDKCGGSGGSLTNDGYAGIGRLRGALGRHANEVYRGIGGEAKQRLVQRIFLELVQLGEGAQDTRRRVPKETLLQLGAPEEVERLIADLASQRLLATSGQGPQSPAQNFVEVSHEALIREWPALRMVERQTGRSPSRTAASASR